MGFFQDAKASAIGTDAATAAQAGRLVFVAMLHGHVRTTMTAAHPPPLAQKPMRPVFCRTDS